MVIMVGLVVPTIHGLVKVSVQDVARHRAEHDGER